MRGILIDGLELIKSDGSGACAYFHISRWLGHDVDLLNERRECQRMTA